MDFLEVRELPGTARRIVAYATADEVWDLKERFRNWKLAAGVELASRTEG